MQFFIWAELNNFNHYMHIMIKSVLFRFEVGAHSELIDLKGDYWRLVKNQLELSI